MNNWNILIKILNALISRSAGFLFDGLLSDFDLALTCCVIGHMFEYAFERFKTGQQTISSHRETEMLKERFEYESYTKEVITYSPDGRPQHKFRETKEKFRHSRDAEHRDEKD